MCVSTKFKDDSFIVLIVYVDDMLVAGLSMLKINDLKGKLEVRYFIKDLGEVKQLIEM